MKTMCVLIFFDGSKLTETELTDSMNEWHHGMAQSLNLPSDEATGGYVGYDWEYERTV